MSNEKNLIPFNKRTESEQREIAQQGGIASGKARRRKRSMKEAADYYLSLPETDRRRVNALLRDAVDPEDIDNQMAVIKGITARAKKGDPQAANVLLKMLGEDNPPDDTAADTLERARSCRRNSVRRLNYAGNNGLRLNVAVVRLNCVNNLFALAVFFSRLNTELNVCALLLVVKRLAYIVQKTRALCKGNVRP